MSQPSRKRKSPLREQVTPEAPACPGCGSTTLTERCDRCGAASRAGDFVIERVLSERPHGRVYVALGPDGRRVALKELLFAVVPDVQRLEAFEREGKVLQQLRHPAIPRFVASFQEGSGVHTRLYLAQEYVEGESLLARLDQHRFNEREAMGIARQVLEILQYLHGLSPRLIHRDIKPANLIVRGDGRLVLVDFDSARDLRAGRTHGSTLVGTIGYMPLEQYGGTVDETTDLYGLGATLVHLLSRKPPHEVFDPRETPRTAKWVSASAGFTAFLDQLLALEPSKRFPTATAALAALDAISGAPAPSKASALSEPRAGENASTALSKPRSSFSIVLDLFFKPIPGFATAMQVVTLLPVVVLIVGMIAITVSRCLEDPPPPKPPPPLISVTEMEWHPSLDGVEPIEGRFLVVWVNVVREGGRWDEHIWLQSILVLGPGEFYDAGERPPDLVLTETGWEPARGSGPIAERPTAAVAWRFAPGRAHRFLHLRGKREMRVPDP